MQRNPMLEERCDMMTFRLRGPIHRETCFIANLYGLAASITEKKKKPNSKPNATDSPGVLIRSLM